jgi:N-alpha-acetyltransferase 15/16, NatA auxiliary subunit
VDAVIKSDFTLIPADADLQSYNAKWQTQHSESSPHLQSAYHIQYLLGGISKSQAESELQRLLDSSSISIEDALRGLDYLDEWKSDRQTKDAYWEKGAAKWPESTAFQKQ